MGAERLDGKYGNYGKHEESGAFGSGGRCEGVKVKAALHAALHNLSG
jgi:hypothetical protein